MNKLVALDAGHGMDTAGKRTPKFPDGSFMKEREFNKSVVERIKPILSRAGFDVLDVAESDTDVPLATRTGLANNTIKNRFNRPADFYLSVHANAFGDGISFNATNGVETFVYSTIKPGSQTETFGRIMHARLRGVRGLADRGLKRENFYVLRETKMPAVLVECGFMTNLTEAKLLISDEYRQGCAEALAAGICEIFSGKTRTPIIGYDLSVTLERLRKWAAGKGGTTLFIELAETFDRICRDINVNQALAYCQAAKETAFGRFGGVLDDSFCNPCGMKTSEGGGDYDAPAHKRFGSWREGIQAQVDHLALYAGAAGYPKAITPDPRHFPYLYGKCETAEELGGNWAPSPSYGEDIVKLMEQVKAVGGSTGDIDTLLDKLGARITLDRAHWKLVLEGIIPCNKDYLQILLARLV